MKQTRTHDCKKRIFAKTGVSVINKTSNAQLDKKTAAPTPHKLYYVKHITPADCKHITVPMFIGCA
jgi:hypothetical protein